MIRRSQQNTSPLPGTPPGPVTRVEAWLEGHFWLTAACVYLAALVLRAIYLLEFRHTLLARVFLMDEAYYHAEAWNLVHGVPNQTDSFFMTPLYPAFLGLVFRVVGDGPSAPYAVQLALGGLIAPLGYSLARKLMRPAFALVTGLACASFAPFLFFEALFLVEWMIMLSLTGALVLALRDGNAHLNAMLSGVLLGIATLGRGSNLLLALPLTIWFWPRNSVGHHKRFHRAGAFVGGMLLVLAPLLIYNATNARQPLLLTANGGFNLFLGNGPEATGIFKLPDDLDLAQDPLALRYVQREIGKPVTASEASKFWVQHTWEWVRSHPGHTLTLYLWKLILFWNRFSFPQIEGLASTIGDLRLSRFPFWNSHAIFPLGFLGVALALYRIRDLRRQERSQAQAVRFRALVMLASCTLIYSASIALFFITDRYRVPIMPCLILLASYCLSEALGALRAERRRRLLLLLLVGVLAFYLTSPERLAIDRPMIERDLHVHDALRFAKAGLFDEALLEYQQALRLDPDDPDVRDGMARMISRAGNDSLAALQLRRLLQDEPDFDRGWYNLGNVYRRLNQNQAAVAAYERALEIDPKREAAWNNLGEAYRALGDTMRAAAAYRRALEIVPAHEQALNNLAALRGSQGDARAAEDGFRAAIAANRRYLPAWRNLAILLTNSGRFQEALQAWEEILILDPNNELAMRTIGEIHEVTRDSP